jgi:dCMP deaminase
MFSEKWDLRFIEMARMVSTWSKDPSTQTGAVLVDDQRRVISVGYNGFAPGVEDKLERYQDRYNTKYKIILHCEENAIVFGDRDRVKGATLYTWPFMSCAKCAGLVIQAGIKTVVTKEAEHVDLTLANDPNRWEHQFVLARTQFEEAGVNMVFYPKDIFK